MECLTASFELRQHSPADDGIGNQCSYIFGVQPRDYGAVRILHSVHIGEENQRVGVAGHSAGRCHLIGIDVVVFAIRTESHGRQDRNSSRTPDGFDPARLGIADFSNKSQIAACILFLARSESHAIGATETNGSTPRSYDCRDQALIYDPGQHHQSDVAGLGIGDAQSVYEVTLLAQQLQSSSECASSSMNYGNVMTVLR